MARTVLVTGGAGFIGSNLCKYLLKDSHTRVICIDDFSTGKEANIVQLRDNPNFCVLNWDITKPFLNINHIDKCVTNITKINQIYHLACPASPLQYGKDPLKTINTNYMGTLNVLELAKEIGARVVFASTSETYGEPLEHPQKESYRGNVNTLGPRACYDEGKRIAETLVYEYNRQYGVEARIVRIFNTYGPNLSHDDGRVVSNFMAQALNDEPITIYGDGSQTRCFCYVDDLVDGLTKLMNYNDPLDKGILIVNLGNDKEYTVKELAELVIRLTQSCSTIIYKDLPIDDPSRRCPDLSRAKELLKWHPSTSLTVGLTRLLKEFD